MSDDKPHAGRELFMRSMRKVLVRHGYSGEALEAKIAELLQKDVRRLAAVINRLEPGMVAMTDAELREKTEELKARLLAKKTAVG